MEIVVAVLVGVGLGWMLGRRRPPTAGGDATEGTGATTRGSYRPTKKQRAILDNLPVDRPRPTLDDLIVEELEETGAARIPGAAALPPAVTLRVYRRDRPRFEAVPIDRLRFLVADGVVAGEATIDDVTLAVDR